MAIHIKEINNLAEKNSNSSAETVFTSAAFRLALAKEYKLKAIDLKFDYQGQELLIPAFLKSLSFSNSSYRLILGAGFDKTGEINSISSAEYTDLISNLLQQIPTLPVKVPSFEIRTTNYLPCTADYSDKVELIVDLNKSCQERLKGFSQSTRRNLRQPFKQGFHFKIGNTLELLQQFYALYLKHMQTIGSLPHSWRFFEELHQSCQPSISLFIGYFDETPVVTSFAFLNDQEIYGAWLGMDPDFKKHNLLLTMLWSITEYSEQIGKRYYNLGRSSRSSNAYEFKKRFADHIQPIHYYHLTAAQPAPASRSVLYDSAAWVIRNTPPVVMNTLSRHLLHKFY